MKTLKTSLHDIFRNSISSLMFIGVISTSIFMVSTFFSVLYNLDSIHSGWSKKATIMIFPTQTEHESLYELLEILEKNDLVLSVELLDQNEVLQILKKRFPDQKLDISPVYLPKLIELRADVGDVNHLAELIKAYDNIDDVLVNSAWFDNLSELIHAISYIVAFIAILVLILSLLLLSYAGKVSLLQRKPEIDLMKLCGATNWYIRKPYMASGLILGFVGSLLGLLVYILVDGFVKGMAQYFISTWHTLPYTYLLIILFLGMMLGMFANFFALSKGFDSED